MVTVVAVRLCGRNQFSPDSALGDAAPERGAVYKRSEEHATHTCVWGAVEIVSVPLMYRTHRMRTRWLKVPKARPLSLATE